MKVFFDTNVVVDALSHRDEESYYSQLCYELAASSKIVGYLNAKQITDIYYLSRKAFDQNSIRLINIEILCNVFCIVPLDKVNLLNSIKRGFSDFEDGVIDESAKLYCCDAIITRNKQDFKNSKNLVMSPKEFVSYYKAMSNS